MKKINPFKKLYYNSIREIELKSGESMSKKGRRFFLLGWIGVAILILYLLIVMIIQPVVSSLMGNKPAEPPISVHMVKNLSPTNVTIYESESKNSDEVLLYGYDNDDSIYYILSLKDNSYCKMSAFVGEDELELVHLDGNQYFMKFIKNKDETVRYNIRLEKQDGSVEMYTFAYDSK